MNQNIAPAIVQAIVKDKKHSSVVGGSTADRILNCPGSYQAILALPPSADVPSLYADEGTAMHEVMDHILRQRRDLMDLDCHEYARTLLGQTFYDRTLTQEHLDTMVLPALDKLEELEAHYGGDFEVAEVEVRVRFPGIPNAFGTVDMILISPTHVLIADWKFGAGISVLAVYKTEDGGELLNPQMAFYTTGALHSYRNLFSNRTIAIGIIQPRTETPLTHTTVSRKELKWFAQDLEKAVATAIDRDPPTKKGPWCRFAACKVNCEHWIGPLLDLSALGVVPEKHGDAQVPKVTPYGQYLSDAKFLIDMVVMMKTEIDKQLQAFLEDGGLVPGWRLKLKTKNRAWAPEEIVEPVLRKLGFDDHEIFQKKLQTFTSVDATAKRLGVTVPANLRVAPPTSELTICATEDPAPMLDRASANEAFAVALKQLKG